MRLGRLIKEKEIELIKSHIKGSSSFCLFSFSKVGVNDFNLLRRSLKKHKSQMLIVENSLLRRVFKELRLTGLGDFIQGPTALVSMQDDIVGPSKTLVNFSKDFQGLKIQAGFMDGKITDTEKILEIAKLPGIDILRAQVVGALKAPIVNLAGVLKNILGKVIWALNAIKDKKEVK